MMNPHRGGMILAFGIIGLVVCHPFGIAAWVMGNNDLKEMDQGYMDRSGRDLTNVGKILGIIGTALMALQIVLVGIYVFIIAIAAIASH